MPVVSFIAPEVTRVKNSISGFCLSCYFTERDPVFKGHYPTHPIIPASLVIGFCFEKIKCYQDASHNFQGELFVSRAVFQDGIKPDQTVLFDFAFEANQNAGSRATVTISVTDTIIATIIYKIGCSVKCYQQPTFDIFDRNINFPAIYHLPQRYPLLLIDRIFPVVDNEHAYAVKYVSNSDYCYRDFTDDEISYRDMAFPTGGVIEGIEQSATLLLEQKWSITDSNNLVVIGGLSGIKFYGNAYPGDIIHYFSSLQYISESSAIISGCAVVDDQVIMEIEKILVVMTLGNKNSD